MGAVRKGGLRRIDLEGFSTCDGWVSDVSQLSSAC